MDLRPKLIFKPVAYKACPPHKKIFPLSSRRRICFEPHDLLGAVDQTEDIVEHKVAARAIGLQLEALGVVHGLLLLIDLLKK